MPLLVHIRDNRLVVQWKNCSKRKGSVYFFFSFFIENTPEDELQKSNRPLHREFATYDYSLIPSGLLFNPSIYVMTGFVRRIKNRLLLFGFNSTSQTRYNN